MKKLNKKKVILLIIIVILVLLITIYTINIKHKPNDMENINYINGEKYVDYLKISNISIEKIEDEYKFIADVTNTSENTCFFGGSANLVFKDENNDEILNYIIWIPEILNGETITIETYVSEKTLNAKDVYIEDYNNR